MLVSRSLGKAQFLHRISHLYFSTTIENRKDNDNVKEVNNKIDLNKYSSRELTKEEEDAYLDYKKNEFLNKIEGREGFEELDKTILFKIHENFSHRDEWNYSKLLTEAANRDDYTETCKIFKKMRECLLIPTQAHYNLRIKSLSTHPRCGIEFLKILDEMKNDKVLPSRHTFLLILTICIKMKNNIYETLNELLDAMKQYKIELDLEILNVFLWSLKGQDLEKIGSVWKFIIRSFPCLYISWIALFEALLPAYPLQVIWLFDRIIDIHPLEKFPRLLKPDERWVKERLNLDMEWIPKCVDQPIYDLFKYALDASLIIKNYCYSKEIFNVLTTNLVDKIKWDVSLVLSMLKLSARISLEDLETSIKIIKKKNIEATKSVYNSIILAYGAHGELKKALKYFTEAEKKGFLDSSSFTGILLACRKNGDVNRAWFTLSTMYKLGIPLSDAYYTLLKETLETHKKTDLLDKLENHILVKAYKQHKGIDHIKKDAENSNNIDQIMKPLVTEKLFNRNNNQGPKINIESTKFKLRDNQLIKPVFPEFKIDLNPLSTNEHVLTKKI